jgi:HAD superfamily hydrolase (TIGR01459 family)
MLPWALRDWRGEVFNMRIRGLADIAERFDAILIDQFGVIYDGQALYPGAFQVLFELRARRIPVIALTNSGKRAAANRERLKSMGLPREFFIDAVSSGEVAYQIIDRSKKAFIIGRRGDSYGFDHMPTVERIEDAEVLLILGSDAPDTSLGDYENMLRHVRLPAICCNPDKQMLTPHGLQSAPGAIAAVYERLGGKVTWIGKPHRAIYDFALDVLDRPKRVLCIGDSAEHDVAGGKAAGFATLLVQQGVSADLPEVRIVPKPDYIASSFSW